MEPLEKILTTPSRGPVNTKMPRIEPRLWISAVGLIGACVVLAIVLALL